MKEYKLSSARGKKLYGMGITCCWSSLHNLYDRWSDAKQDAFEYCLAEYRSTEKPRSVWRRQCKQVRIHS